MTALPGGHAAIYATPGYEKLRRVIAWAVRRKALVACTVVGVFLASVAGMGFVKQQFFPQSDRPEVLVEVTEPQGTSIEATNASSKKVEDWLRLQPEAKIVTAHIGAGAPRFFFRIIQNSRTPISPKSLF
jgi:multidrug efflux pump subunit AcrB